MNLKSLQNSQFVAFIVTKGGRLLCQWAGCLLLLGGSLTVVGAPLDQWHWRSPDPTGNRLNAVGSGVDRYVAVGELGSVVISDNARNWELVESGAWVSLRDVAWGDGVWVAVGDFGTILSSPDGVSWTLRPMGYYYDLHGVTWGGGVFVTVGANNSILTSSDGEQWDLRATGTHPLRAVTWGDGRFVAVGGEPPVGGVVGQSKDGKPLILTSTDGREWLRQEVAVAGQLTCIGYGAGRFVAGTTSARTVASMDAVHWAEGNIPYYERYEAQSVQWVAGRFVATMGGPHGYPMGYYVSGDGAAWTFEEWEMENGSITGYMADLTVGPAGAVGVTHGMSVILTSQLVGSIDGRNWRVLDRALPDFEPAITWAGDRFFVRETARYANYQSQPETIYLTSADGRHWESILASASKNFELPAYGQGRWVAGGEAGMVLVSSDAVEWQSLSTGESSPLRWTTYANGRFLATGEEGVLVTSPDGLVWTREQLNTTGSLGPVAWSGGVFAVAEIGAPVIWTSTDAKQWTSRNVPDSVVAVGTLQGWEEGFHALVTVDPYWTIGLLHSADGVNWEFEHVPGPNAQLLATGGGQLLVFGNSTIHERGAGSVNWIAHWLPWITAQAGIIYGGPAGAAFGRDTFLVVRHGQMLQSDPLGDLAPWMNRPPMVVTTSTNAEVTLQAVASGSSPLRYQWRRDGMDLEGMTRSTLTVVAGELMANLFTVRVENEIGSMESEPASVAYGFPARLEMGSDLAAVYVWGTAGGRYRLEEGTGFDAGGRWSTVAGFELPHTGGPMRLKVPWRTQWPMDQHWFYRAVLVP
jgi:hypothetical protein